MREENQCGNGGKASKFTDQNQCPAKGVGNKNNVKATNGHLSKVKSSWGSQIVKGFSGEKKSNKLQAAASQGFSGEKKSNKLQAAASQTALTSSNAGNQKNTLVISHSRAKRSLIGDLSCSISAAQVHPHSFNAHKASPRSRDLFLELDNLRALLQESKEREFKLQTELSECRKNPKVFELEREIELKKDEISKFVEKVELLEAEKFSLSEQLVSLNYILGRQDDKLTRDDHESLNGVEMEVVELRRLNKELQLQKRSLACRLSSLESELATSAKVSETDIVEKIKEEASLLRHTNEDLCKQVEGLQMSRLNEVEELAYLRWVNSCLRNELRNSSNLNPDTMASPYEIERPRESICLSSSGSEEDSGYSGTLRLNLVKKLKKWPITDEDMQQLQRMENFKDHDWDNSQSSSRRHSISGLKYYSEDFMLDKRRQSDGFMHFKEAEKEVQMISSQKYDSRVNQRPEFLSRCQEACRVTASVDVERRAVRIPNPPPRPSNTASSIQKTNISVQVPVRPPPPPPPPPPKFMGRNMTGTVKRAPQVVEFYHSLMKRDSRKDSLNSGTCDASDAANVRSSMIGEIENRSSYLLAIKADVETQGEFVNSLIHEVNNAVYQNIEDLVAFVKWLDDELSFLVDERAVLKHFEWPEKKADTLREAAFGYRDLKKLEHEIDNYIDDPLLSCDAALRKTVALSEKMERIVYNLLGMRDLMIRRCKEFQIPTDWMLDTGILSKIKFASVKLAKVYTRRVAMELQSKGVSDKDSSMDYMLLQGVRFAFRIHQFAGGFDAETMHAFEELRNLSVVLNRK